jgi:lipase ATG15
MMNFKSTASSHFKIHSLRPLLVAGFLLVFCLQVLLFLVLDLAIEVGATSKSKINVGATIGVILSFPIFIFGLASALVLAGYYLADTWRGHPLIKNFVFSSLHPVLTEWIAFLVYLGVPLVVMGVTLLTKTSLWWEITMLVWFYCVLAFYVVFTFNVVWYETRACWEIMKNRYDEDVNSFVKLVGRCIVVRQINTYSGQHDKRFLASGTLDVRISSRRLHHDHVVLANTKREWKSLWTRVTLWPILSNTNGWHLFEHLAEPEPVYTVDEARGVRPYVTSYTWSLEKFFCRSSDSRYIAVVRGPGALTKAQIWSSLVCAVVGTFLFILLVIGVLVWLAVPGAVIGVLVALFALVFIPRVRSNYRWYHTTRGLLRAGVQRDEEVSISSPGGHLPMQQGESEGIYLVVERKRLTRPTDLFCWVMFVLELSVFFLYPFGALLRVRNYPIATLFVIVTGVSALRFYVNPAVVLEETGHIDLLDGDEGTDKLWKNESRLNEIVGGITRGKTRGIWNIVLGVVGIIFLALFFGAIIQKDSPSNSGSSSVYTFLDDFYYEQQADLPYPTCQFGKGFAESPTNHMVDYAFLAGVAYRDQNVTQSQLDGWFGPNLTMDGQDVVNEFRYQTDNYTSAVTFKLILFPNSNASIVSISGTTNILDDLTDAQLWSAAFLLQIVRAILPAGHIFTPILDHLVYVMKILESASIDKVSFYRTTTDFVKSLLQNGTFGLIQVTGHSLGGGLSIITGAQTHVSAVALSGPNAKISRRTFDPPVTIDELNTYTFNIIPERDVVPMIDDRAELFQMIRCGASANNFLGCHDPTRSFCEILTTCGSGSRPALCDCATGYGFPPPKPKGNRTFLEACASLISDSAYAQFIRDSVNAN